tara:strand:+ start:2970 stop:3164 length:195 start_codon:yes stop_codon:yes gene_type:complete
MSNFSESAVALGQVQASFEMIYGRKEMIRRLTKKERTSELLRMCNQHSIPFWGFQYLERKLLGE